MSGSDRDVFVGRRAELEQLERRFAGGARLVTLLGPPGVGKTRLAKRYAGELLGRGRDVVICDMAAVTDRDAMLRALAQALDLPPLIAEDGTWRLTRALAARRPVLVVLDNLEQIAGPAGDLAEALLEGGDEVAVLGTSREPLRIAGETRQFVEPLDPVEGAELFRLRADARGADPGSLEDGAAISEIVSRLDGLPLAVELAAARAVVLSPGEILSRLERRFELLRRADREEEVRRATLQASIEASWELLSPAEQSTLAQCSVFPDGFSVEAAEAVVELDGAGEGAILDHLQALRERSLIRSAVSGGERQLGATRLFHYESIRQYAGERLEQAGGAQAARARHAEVYAARANRLAELASTSHREDSLAEMAAIEAHLLQAHREAPEPADRARLGIALAIHFGVWGPRARQLASAEAASAAAEETGSDVLLARALQLQGHSLLEGGGAERAIPLLERAVDLARRAGDGPTERFASLGLAMIALREMRLDELEERCMAILREASEEEAAVRSLVLSRLPMALTVNDRLEDARAVVATELVSARRTGSQQHEAACLMSLGLCEHEAGKLAAARDHYEQSLRLFRVTGPRSETATVLLLKAWIEIEDGDHLAAQRHLDEAWLEQRDLANPALEGWTYMVTGVRRLALGDPGEAVLAFRSSLEHGRGQNLVESYARPFAVLALAGADRLEDAEELFAASRARGWRDYAVLAGLWELCAASIELGRARAQSDRSEVARRHVDAARAVLEGLPAAPGETRTFIRNNARFALSRDLARTEAIVGERTTGHGARAATIPGAVPDPGPQADGGDDRPAMIVEADGARLLPPGAEHGVDLHRRGPVRRILLRLAEAHGEGPEPLAVEDLLDAGWPGERVSFEAGVARVYSAVATLRKLGLRDILETVDGGYRLSPRVDVRVDRPA